MIEIATEETQTRHVGRPSKYTPERVTRILDLLRDGNTRKATALASGISVDTLADWQERYPDFSEQVKEAEGQAESKHVANILTAAGKGAWQASAWWLERRRHEDWGKKDRIEVINSVRELARATNQDEEAAVQQADQILRELRSQARA